MTSSQRRSANYVNVVLNSLAGSLGRSLEQRSHIYVKATVGIACCHYLSTAVVTVLSHLGYEDTGTATFLLSELVCQLASQLKLAVVL